MNEVLGLQALGSDEHASPLISSLSMGGCFSRWSTISYGGCRLPEATT